MNRHDYFALPEGMSASEVANILDKFLAEECNDSLSEKYYKLDVVGDKQWHTYQPASDLIKDKVRQWILSNWDDNDDFYAIAMGLCYNFGLERALYQRALEPYKGKQRWEYLQMLERSEGPTIDTYACFAAKTKPQP